MSSINVYHFNCKSPIKMIIEAFESLYSGYSFEEIITGWHELYFDVLNKYQPLNELEYE